MGQHGDPGIEPFCLQRGIQRFLGCFKPGKSEEIRCLPINSIGNDIDCFSLLNLSPGNSQGCGYFILYLSIRYQLSDLVTRF